MAAHAGTHTETTTTSTPSIDTETELEELHDLAARDAVSVTETDAACCGASGCTCSDAQLFRVDVDDGRRRTLCPSHAADFIRRETTSDV